MAEYSFTCIDAASTAELGARLGRILKIGDIVLLYGDLGAGKTTFVRGLVQSQSDTEVVSPTFTLVQSYDLLQGVLYHYDLYRLNAGDDSALEELGWDNGLMHGMTIVEWPERLAQAPRDALIIRFEPAPDGTRLLRLTGAGDWPARLAAL